MQPALSQVCSLGSPFEKDVADYAAGACRAIDIWLGKLETYLESHSVDDVRRLLEQNDVVAPVASYQGGLFDGHEDARREHWRHFGLRLELCRQLGIGTLVIAADIPGPLVQQDLDRVNVSLAEAAGMAGPLGVRLALEFQARAAFINNLQSAAAVVEELGSPHVGICLDAFHYAIGPSKPEDLGCLTRDNLFHVQLCDVAGVARELATDADRILPGDGDFCLEPILRRLREIEYDGCVSVELMNPRIWQIPARQFGEIGITALRKALGLATMGSADHA